MDMYKYMTAKITAYLNEHCSGSGIDNGWESADATAKNLKITSSFHCMDEHGYYDGWQDFFVKLPVKDLADFSIHFTGNRKHVWHLKEYLEQTMDFVLGECLQDMSEEVDDDVGLS